tara:strand:+ start:1665 stop:2321 length:657 start_codon:yes stop_codon:yes gene_type:complete
MSSLSRAFVEDEPAGSWPDNARGSYAKLWEPVKTLDDGTVVISIVREETDCLQQGQLQSHYYPELSGYISEETFSRSIRDVNALLDDLPSLWMGYGPCIPASLIMLCFFFALAMGLAIPTVIYPMWGLFSFLGVAGFIYFFYMDGKLDEAVAKLNRQMKVLPRTQKEDGSKLRWARGKGNRHDHLELHLSPLDETFDREHSLDIEEDSGGEESAVVNL